MDRSLLLEMFRQMVRIRAFETRVGELFAQGKIPGFVHLYIGEEATAVGVCSNLKPSDYITSTHRGHGHCLAKGGDMKAMMAELFGRKSGYCKGKGGSMHIADVDIGILGANGIVGGGLTVAAGAALSAKMRGTDQVTVCFFGDGASNQTTFHEGLNIASIWNLPVVYVCENNLYGISMHQSRHQKVADVADRAGAYGIPGVTVDGNDVMAVYEAAKEAIGRARAGDGPTLLECKTYRWKGHFEGDPTLYRSVEELEEWKRRCPILAFNGRLLEMEALSPEEAASIQSGAEAEVEDAVKCAAESPFPSPEEALEDLFA